MTDYKHLRSVTMTYSVVGHSCIQNVDNMHSNIEKAMRVSEFFSPNFVFTDFTKLSPSKTKLYKWIETMLKISVLFQKTLRSIEYLSQKSPPLNSVEIICVKFCTENPMFHKISLRKHIENKKVNDFQEKMRCSPSLIHH